MPFGAGIPTAEHADAEPGTESAEAEHAPAGPKLGDIVGQGSNAVDRLGQIAMDRVRLAVHKRLMGLLAGILAAVVLAVALGTATWFAVQGLCAAIAAIWPEAAWTGNLLGGLSILGGTAFALWLWMRITSSRELKEMRARYENLRTPEPDPAESQ